MLQGAEEQRGGLQGAALPGYKYRQTSCRQLGGCTCTLLKSWRAYFARDLTQLLPELVFSTPGLVPHKCFKTSHSHRTLHQWLQYFCTHHRCLTDGRATAWTTRTATAWSPPAAGWSPSLRRSHSLMLPSDAPVASSSGSRPAPTGSRQQPPVGPVTPARWHWCCNQAGRTLSPMAMVIAEKPPPRHQTGVLNQQHQQRPSDSVPHLAQLPAWHGCVCCARAPPCVGCCQPAGPTPAGNTRRLWPSQQALIHPQRQPLPLP
jgi:hypothetical protein